jgi:hypothetical protein
LDYFAPISFVTFKTHHAVEDLNDLSTPNMASQVFESLIEDAASHKVELAIVTVSKTPKRPHIPSTMANGPFPWF